jgi:uncharacterized protein (TIGR02246 family)
MKRDVAFLTCAALLAGCVNPKVQRMESDKAAVQARLQHYAALMLAMDTSAIATMFAPDGEMVNPKQPPVKGRDAIEKFLSGYSDYKVLSNVDAATSILVDGDTAEQIGTYAQKVRTPDGQLFEASGRLEIGWVRGSSGEWLISQLATFPGK